MFSTFISSRLRKIILIVCFLRCEEMILNKKFHRNFHVDTTALNEIPGNVFVLYWSSICLHLPASLLPSPNWLITISLLPFPSWVSSISVFCGLWRWWGWVWRMTLLQNTCSSVEFVKLFIYRSYYYSFMKLPSFECSSTSVNNSTFY